MSEQEVMERLAKHSVELAELFDHVQILVTWDEDGITKMRHAGRGNWWARMGMAKAFCERDQANNAADLFAEKLQPPPDSGDAWKEGA